MPAIVTTLIIVAIVVIGILVVIAVIKRNLSRAAHKYLGMGLDETARLISDGLREESSTPKAISNMSAVYKPKLMRDFPQMTYEQFETLAKTTLLSTLGAIENESTDGLENTTRGYISAVQSIISDNHGRNVTEYFDDIKVHRLSIADYKSSADSAKAVFEASFQCRHYFSDTPENNRNSLSQLAAKIILVYSRESFEDSDNAVFSHNCPNCGAPIYGVGENTVCKYCGSGFTEKDITKVWLADSFNFIK